MTSVTVGKLGSAVYPAGATVGPRTLSEFEFVWILSGSAWWWTAEQTIEVRPGQLVLVRPGMRHRLDWAPQQPTTHGYVHFSLTGSWRPTTLRIGPILRIVGEDDPLPATLRYLLRLDATSNSDRDIAAELVRFVVVLFTSGPSRSDRVATTPRCGIGGRARLPGLGSVRRRTRPRPR